MDSIIQTFHVDAGLLIAQAVNFGVVAVVLWWFGFKPLAKLLEGRAEKIEQGLKDASGASERLKQAEQEATEIIKTARSEAQAAITTASEAANRLRSEELAKVKVDVEKTIAAGKVALATEKEEMMKNVKDEIADLVLAATRGVLKEVKLTEVDKSLVDKAITSLK